MKTAEEFLIIGGGIVGLAIAVELRLRGAKVTVLSRDFQQAAAHAAAGMLAPQAEALQPGPMLDLCLCSRDLYPDWTEKLESITGLSTGYWPCGILAPCYESVAQPPVLPESPAQWLDASAIAQHQPGLGDEVIGGWWFPQDAQVDNRALTRSLLGAAQDLGVEIHEGIAVQSLQHQAGKITHLQTSDGDWQAAHYILATGAWSNDLVPVPVYPKKGQMLSVRVPLEFQSPLPLQQVLFGSEIYIVPRQDGRIVIGATSEEVGFTPHNTPAGMRSLLDAAIRLYPVLQQFPIQECWWGFRPATPDELPLLGESAYNNLTLATGHYRNGILLAPATAQLIADFVTRPQPDPLLAHFHYSRFSQM